MGKNKQPAPAATHMWGLHKSASLKKAAAYKKRMGTENIKHITPILLLTGCGFAALLIMFVLLRNKSYEPASEPNYFLLEHGQDSLLAKESGPSMSLGAYSSPVSALQETSLPQKTADNEPDAYTDAIDKMESGLSRMLHSDALADISSEDIQPRTQSNFLPILQQRLMDLYYLEQDEPTTYYGFATEEAIREFQAQHALPVTGVASYDVLLLLFSNDATSKRFTIGEEGQCIAIFQERLAQLGYAVSATGKFGEKTAQAVCELQARNNLPQTGDIDTITQELLFSENVICSNGELYRYTASKQTLNIPALLEIAYAQLGARYVRGGKSPSGFDCSGLVYYCLRKSGYQLAYMTSSGWRNTGFQYIKHMQDLQAGDICTFVGHVGIYVGYGKMIDASSSEGRVRITGDIQQSSYWRDNWKGGRRISEDAA